MRRLLQTAAFLVLAAITAGALVSSATSATVRQGYNTGPSGTTGPTGSTTATPTVTRTPTASPTPINVCCSGPKKKKPKLKFKILRHATATRLIVKARVNMKAKVTFRVFKGKHDVGRKVKRFKKKGKKRVKIQLQTVKIGLRRPVKLKVVGQAKAGSRKSKKVKHKTKLT
jgi:uncharacterized protein (DUF736 family)